MEKIIVVQKNGLMQFVTGERKPWQIWKKPLLLSPFNAATFDLHKSNEMRDKAQDIFKDHIVLTVNYNHDYPSGLAGDGVPLASYKYFVVVGRSKYLHKTIYYTYDQEYFSKKRKRRMFKPVFDKDINKAEFIKSRKYAEEIETRCRQTGKEMVAVREVYVYEKNILLGKNIIVVLKHRENKKMKPQFMRAYDKATGDFTKTSRYEQAERFTYDEYLDLYEQFHALHKDYMMLPKFDRRELWSFKAKDVDGQEQVEVTLRLRKNK